MVPNFFLARYTSMPNDDIKAELFVMNGRMELTFKKYPAAPQYQGQTNVEDYLHDSEADWSPDSEWIVFVSNRHVLLGKF